MKDNNFLLCDEGEASAAHKHAVEIMDAMSKRSISFKLEVLATLRISMRERMAQLQTDMEKGLAQTQDDLCNVKATLAGL